MIPTAEIPTDNFYKFCALSGLALFIVSILLYAEMYTDIRDRVLDRELTVTELNEKVNWLESDVKDLRKLIDDLVASKSGKADSRLDKLGLDYSNDEIKSMVKDAEAKMRELIISRAKSKLLTDDLIRRSRLAYWLGYELVIQCIAGLLLSIYGFQKWYRLAIKHNGNA